MIVCEFCLHQTQDGKCRLQLDLPKAMSCREFLPGLEKFCSDPRDYVNPNQIIETAVFFGFHRLELKKVKQMAVAAREQIADLTT